MRNPITSALDNLTARFELYATEVRTGITLIEAVEADATMTQIQAITGHRAITQEVLDICVDLMKTGLTPDDVADGLRFKWRMEALGVTNEDLMVLAYEKQGKA